MYNYYREARHLFRTRHVFRALIADIIVDRLCFEITANGGDFVSFLLTVLGAGVSLNTSVFCKPNSLHERNTSYALIAAIYEMRAFGTVPAWMGGVGFDPRAPVLSVSAASVLLLTEFRQSIATYRLKTGRPTSEFLIYSNRQSVSVFAGVLRTLCGRLLARKGRFGACADELVEALQTNGEKHGLGEVVACFAQHRASMAVSSRCNALLREFSEGAAEVAKLMEAGGMTVETLEERFERGVPVAMGMFLAEAHAVAAARAIGRRTRSIPELTAELARFGTKWTEGNRAPHNTCVAYPAQRDK